VKEQKNNIFVITIIACLTLLFLVGSFVWHIGEQKTRAGEVALYRRFLTQEGKTEQEKFKQIQGIAKVLAKNQMIIEILEKNTAPHSSELSQLKRYVNLTLQEIAALPYFSVALILDHNGDCILSSLARTIGKNYSFRPYFQQAAKRGYGLYAAVGITDHKLGLYYSLPIRLEKKFIGVAVVKFSPDFFSNTVLTPNNPAVSSRHSKTIVGIAMHDGIFFSLPEQQLYSLYPFPADAIEKMVRQKRFPTNIIKALHFPRDGWRQLRQTGFLESSETSDNRNCLLFLEPIFKNELFLLHIIDEDYFHQAYNALSHSQQYLQIILTFTLLLLCAAFIALYRHHLKLKKTLQQLLHEENQRHIFHLAIEQNASTIMLTDPEGNIEYVNPATCLTSGYQKEEILGANPRIFQSGQHDENFYQTLWKTITNGESWHGRICNRHKDGTIYWEEAVISPVLDKEGELTHFLAIKTNISDKLEMEQQLQEALIKAQTANQAKTEFLANFSHEIRTPMNTIIGMTQLLLESRLDPEQKKLLTSVYNAGTILLNLLNDILDLSKIEAGQLNLISADFSLYHLVETVSDTMSSAAATAGLAFVVDLDRHRIPEFLIGDEFRIRQILLNLIDNAIKFTERGKITLRITPPPGAPENTATVTLEFAVIDTGIGIPEEQLNRIFQSFSQVDSSMSRRHQGTGLGLAICKHLIEMMGGTLAVRSRPGHGSTFYFTLAFPLGRPVTMAENKKLTVSDHKAAILVVDDHPMNRELALMILKQAGYSEIATAESGIEALDRIAAENYDLVFMDLQMPELDGYSTTRIIRRCELGKPLASEESNHLDAELETALRQRLAGRHLPIIALTAHAMSSIKKKCLETGMDDFLTKPFVIEDFITIINRCLGHNQDKSPNTDKKQQTEPAPDGSPLQQDILTYLRQEYQIKEDHALQLIELSQRNLEKNFEALQKAFDNKDFTTLRKIAHGIKGILLNIGQQELAAAALELEENGGPQSARMIESLKAEISQLFEKYR